MSRIAKNPITLPQTVQAQLQAPLLTLSSAKGQLQHKIAKGVEVTLTDNVLTFAAQGRAKSAQALAGTTRAVVNNMVQGLAQGFQIKLLLEGVGYRAQVQ
ncbi:MAG: 50S ribosomal protein L6, partial [Pseudomonadota bacterium]|nr:50S ribosomal protein L6 [Pseudomonadota bacterium]